MFLVCVLPKDTDLFVYLPRIYNNTLKLSKCWRNIPELPSKLFFFIWTSFIPPLKVPLFLYGHVALVFFLDQLVTVLLLSGCLQTAKQQARQWMAENDDACQNRSETFTHFYSPPPPPPHPPPHRPTIWTVCLHRALKTHQHSCTQMFTVQHTCIITQVCSHTHIQTLTLIHTQHLCACIILFFLFLGAQRRLFWLNWPKVWMWWTVDVGTSQQDQQIWFIIYIVGI